MVSFYQCPHPKKLLVAMNAVMLLVSKLVVSIFAKGEAK